MTTLQELVAKLRLDPTGFNSGLKDAKSQITSFGKNFAKGVGIGLATAALAGISSNIADVVRGIAEIGDEAKRAGMSLKAFQEWKFVAEQNRISVDALVDGFKELSLRVDEFVVTGGGSAAESLQRLGYSASELKDKIKDPSALMLEMLGRMQSLDSAAQIRISDELFGGTAGERFVELLSQGEDSLRRTIQTGHEVGAVMDAEMIQKADQLNRQFEQLQSIIGNTFKQGVVDAALFFERFGKFAGGDAVFLPLEEQTATLNQTTNDLIISLNEVEDMYRSVGANPLAEITARTRKEVAELSVQYQRGLVPAEEYSQQLVTVADDARAALERVASLDDPVFGGVIERLGGLIIALGKVAGAAISARNAMPGSVDVVRPGKNADDLGIGEPRSALAPATSPKPKAAPDNIDFGLPPAGKGGGGGGGGNGYAAEVQRIRDRVDALNEEAGAFIEAAVSGRRYGDAVEYAKTRAELLAKAQAEGKKITPELAAEIDRLALSYSTAASEAENARARLEDLQDRSKRGADAVADMFMAIGKGSDAAKQAIGGLLAEMARVAAQRAFLRMATSGVAGGAFGWLGGLLANADGNAFEGGRVTAFANGGVVQGATTFAMQYGQLGLMGEAGPEAIMPLKRGPDGRLGVMSYSGPRQSLDVTVGFDQSAGGLTAHIKDQAGQVVAAAAPQIVKSAVKETYAASKEVRLG